MTAQEIEWQGHYVWVTGIVSRSGRVHRYVRRYVGRGGMVEREARNGMLIVRFRQNHVRAIPAGCLTKYTDVQTAGPAQQPKTNGTHKS
jgi:hypothetical protein